MPKVKTLTSQLSELRNIASENGKKNLIGIYSVYAEPFNREKVENYFTSIPECIKWRDSEKKNGKYTFFVEGIGSYFRPQTISSFIEIVDSIGETLEVNCSEYVIDKTQWLY